MKKVLSIILALAMLFAFSACGTDTSNNGQASPELPAYVQNINAEGFDEGACIAETVIYDNPKLATVTAKGISYNESGAVLQLEIKNYLDEYLQYDLNNICVNGLMLSSFDFDLVEAGATLTKDVELLYNELIPSGITVITELTLCSLKLTPEDGEEATEVGPVTLQTNALGVAEAAGSVYEAMLSEDNQEQFSYSVLASSNKRTDIADGVYSASTFLVLNDYQQYDFVTELHNDTDETVTVSARRPVVNGMLFPEDSSFLVDLLPHTYCVFAAGLGGYGVSDYCFEALGLSPVCEVSFEYAIEPEGGDATDSVTISLAQTDTADTPTAEGKLVYNKGGIIVRSFGIAPECEGEESFGCASVLFTIENRTDKEYDLQDDGAGALVLNGKEIEFDSKYCTLPAGAVVAVSYETSCMLGDDLGITSISEITSGKMSLHLYYCSTTLEEILIDAPVF